MDGFWYIGATTASQEGVDYETGSKPIKVVARKLENGNLAYAVVKVPGGKHWEVYGGHSVSHPGQYHVLRVLEHLESDAYHCECLIEFPLRN